LPQKHEKGSRSLAFGAGRQQTKVANSVSTVIRHVLGKGCEKLFDRNIE
jgi:hypothetical protein